MDGCDAKCWMSYVNDSDCLKYVTIKLRPIHYLSWRNAIHVSNRTNGHMNMKGKYLHFKCFVMWLHRDSMFIFRFNFPSLLSELIWNDKSFAFGLTEKIPKKKHAQTDKTERTIPIGSSHSSLEQFKRKLLDVTEDKTFANEKICTLYHNIIMDEKQPKLIKPTKLYIFQSSCRTQILDWLMTQCAHFIWAKPATFCGKRCMIMV